MIMIFQMRAVSLRRNSILAEMIFLVTTVFHSMGQYMLSFNLYSPCQGFWLYLVLNYPEFLKHCCSKLLLNPQMSRKMGAPWTDQHMKLFAYRAFSRILNNYIH